MIDLGTSAIFSAINTCFKFSEFAVQLVEVGEENSVFVRTIQRVRSDLDETQRLLCLPFIKAHLSTQPEKTKWIQSVIISTKTALNEIGLHVERARSDMNRDGSISFAVRVRWVLSDHEKLNNRRQELNTCHQSLSTVLDLLQRLESAHLLGHNLTSELRIAFSSRDCSLPKYEEVVDLEDIQGHHTRRAFRKRAYAADLHTNTINGGENGASVEIQRPLSSVEVHSHPYAGPFLTTLENETRTEMQNESRFVSDRIDHSGKGPSTAVQPGPVDSFSCSFGGTSWVRQSSLPPKLEVNFSHIRPLDPVCQWDFEIGLNFVESETTSTNTHIGGESDTAIQTCSEPTQFFEFQPSSNLTLPPFSHDISQDVLQKTGDSEEIGSGVTSSMAISELSHINQNPHRDINHGIANLPSSTSNREYFRSEAALRRKRRSRMDAALGI